MIQARNPGVPEYNITSRLHTAEESFFFFGMGREREGLSFLSFLPSRSERLPFDLP